MDRREFLEFYNLISDDAAAIINNQLVLNGIHNALARNLQRPFEQDYIYSEHFGQRPSEPIVTQVGNFRVTTRILHQTGIRMSDIRGADLLYEIEGEKFALIQYKKSSDAIIKNDPQQLDDLISNCPEACLNKRKRPIPIRWLPLKLNSFCGCWYNVINEEGKHNYMHACEAEAIFSGKGTASVNAFGMGITKDTYLELFSSCRIGAFLRTIPRDGDLLPVNYTEQLIGEQHVIFAVRQQNL
jgi:hypothetical protein